jgi:dihydrodiol dehydrogenase / D-xylose 1-dehydrogenase (NADP)
MIKTIRWGILSTGAIAHKFATGLGTLPDTQLLAVGSRTQQAAETFGNEFSIPRRYGSYQDLVNDPDIDAIYVSSPHPFHKEHTLLCLNAGKAVLCEKPFAMNTREAAEMIRVAGEKKIFLMEAMWTRYLPHMVKVREIIASGAIGEVRMLEADLGFRAELNPQGRLFNPDLGGGALLDVGIYPISLAFMLFGAPAEIKSFANMGTTGIDEEAAILFRHKKGQLALLSTAVRLDTPFEAFILGTKGRIQMHRAWWAPSHFTVFAQGQEPKYIEVDCPLNGYNYEALEVNACLREGKLESSIMPLDETLEIIKTLDAIRSEWGLTYPME